MRLVADNGEHIFDIADDAFHASGGEAELHRHGSFLLKLYKRPEAIQKYEPDYAAKVQAAQRRLEEGEHKLRRFPLDLPAHVVAPLALLYTEDGRFAGFLMEYIDNKGTLHDLLEDPATDINFMVKVFKNLRTLMLAVHEAGVVIADVAPKNVLVAEDANVYLVDADSMQFGSFISLAITRSYTDPLRFGRALDPFLLATPQSDWYSYAAMLFQALFRIRPFEGEMKPGKPHLEFEERVGRRVTVFHNDVRLPTTARPFNIVPAPVMDYFAALFERNVREPFRADLLDLLTWKTCGRHHIPYARTQCPQCIDAARLRQMSHAERQSHRAITPTVYAPGRKFTCFETSGRIMAVTARDRLRVLYRENGALYREHGVLVADSWPQKLAKTPSAYAISGRTSLIVGDGVLRACSPYAPQREATLPSDVIRPMLAVNDAGAYMLNGTDVRPIVLHGRRSRSALAIPSPDSWLWMGERIGLVLSQPKADANLAALFFDAAGDELRRIEDIEIERPSGDMNDVACYFGDDRVWLLFLLQTPAGKTRVQVHVYDFKGGLLLKVRYPAQGYFRRVHGHAAVGDTLLVLDGTTLVKLRVVGNEMKLAGARERALPFVQSHTWLLPANDEFGFAVHYGSITPIQITQA